MNVFRLIADLMHLASIFILLHKIKTSRSCVGKGVFLFLLLPAHATMNWNLDHLGLGISFKSQLLYSVVFLTRYLDLFGVWHSLYNSCMKIFFIATSLYIVYLMQVKFKATYDANLDTFRVEYLLGGAAVFALLTTFDYSVLEVGSCCIMICGIGTRWPNHDRCFGHSRSGLNPWLFFLNYSCSNALVKPRQSQLTTCLHWVDTVPCILSTGSTDISTKAMSIGLLG